MSEYCVRAIPSSHWSPNSTISHTYLNFLIARYNYRIKGVTCHCVTNGLGHSQLSFAMTYYLLAPNDTYPIISLTTRGVIYIVWFIRQVTDILNQWENIVRTFNSCTEYVSNPDWIQDHVIDCHPISWAYEVHGWQLKVTFIHTQYVRGSLTCLAYFFWHVTSWCYQPSTGRRPVDWCRN